VQEGNAHQPKRCTYVVPFPSFPTNAAPTRAPEAPTVTSRHRHASHPHSLAWASSLPTAGRLLARSTPAGRTGQEGVIVDKLFNVPVCREWESKGAQEPRHTRSAQRLPPRLQIRARALGRRGARRRLGHDMGMSKGGEDAEGISQLHGNALRP
jgi:hypothetical protein